MTLKYYINFKLRNKKKYQLTRQHFIEFKGLVKVFILNFDKKEKLQKIKKSI